MNNDGNKKKVLMKSAMAFTFALAMFGANAGADVSAEEAMTTGQAGFNSTFDDGEEEDVQQGDEADNGDDTKGITTNMEESASEETDAEADSETDESEAGEDVSSEDETENDAEADADADGDVQQDEAAEEEDAAEGEDAAEESNVQQNHVVENSTDDDVQQDAEADEEDTDAAEDEAENASKAAAKSSNNSVDLGAANGFNVFVKGDYNVNGADISSNGQLGNLAAGGNVSVPGSYTAGKVVVGGEINGSFLNGTSDEAIDFEEAFKQLEDTSNSLAQLEANGTITQNQWWGAEIIFNGSDPELNVFNITVEEFNAMRAEGGGQLSLSFNVPKGSHCVVNIIGEGEVDLSVNAGAFYAKEVVSNGTDNNKNILFNLPNASNVTIQDNMGALMAVNADVKSAEGVNGNHFEGSLICNSYTGGNEFGANSYVPPSMPDTPDTPDDPDPETPETPDEPEPETPETPDEPEPETPETPDEPEPETPETPDKPEPETPETPEDPPYNPYETIETFDEPEEEPEEEEEETLEVVEFEESEVPLADTPFEEEFETFDDTPVPLSDDPFGDVDSATTNPKTGEDLTVPAVSAAAAMAAFLTILYANKKKREEAQG